MHVVSTAGAQATTSIASPGRRARRHAATQAALLSAARSLMSSGGPDAVTIAAVTERADVGFGTFYGYFASKEQLLEALIADALERLGSENDALTAGLSDPAEVVVVAILNTLGLVMREPELAGVVVRVAYSSDDSFWVALRGRLLRDVRRGVEAGRFVPEAERLAPVLMGGALIAAMRALVEGDLSPADAGPAAAACLAALGVPRDEAAACVAALADAERAAVAVSGASRRRPKRPASV
jgi:AcrR family transcriptional regulator